MLKLAKKRKRLLFSSDSTPALTSTNLIPLNPISKKPKLFLEELDVHDPTANMTEQQRKQYLSEKIDGILSMNSKKEFSTPKKFEDHTFPHGVTSSKALHLYQVAQTDFSLMHECSELFRLAHSGQDDDRDYLTPLPVINKSNLNKTEIQPSYHPFYQVTYRELPSRTTSLESTCYPRPPKLELTSEPSSNFPPSLNENLLSPLDSSWNDSGVNDSIPPLCLDDAFSSSSNLTGNIDLSSSSWQSMLYSADVLENQFPSTRVERSLSNIQPPNPSTKQQQNNSLRLTQSQSCISLDSSRKSSFPNSKSSLANSNSQSSSQQPKKKLFGKQPLFNFANYSKLHCSSSGCSSNEMNSNSNSNGKELSPQVNTRGFDDFCYQRVHQQQTLSPVFVTIHRGVLQPQTQPKSSKASATLLGAAKGMRKKTPKKPLVSVPSAVQQEISLRQKLENLSWQNFLEFRLGSFVVPEELLEILLHQLISCIPKALSFTNICERQLKPLQVWVNSKRIVTQAFIKESDHMKSSERFVLAFYQSYFSEKSIFPFRTGTIPLESGFVEEQLHGGDSSGMNLSKNLVEICSGGDILAVSQGKNRIVLYNVRLDVPKVIKTLVGHAHEITCLRGTTKAPYLLASLDSHANIRVWDIYSSSGHGISNMNLSRFDHGGNSSNNPTECSIQEFKDLTRSDESAKLVWSDSGTWLASFDRKCVVLFNRTSGHRTGNSRVTLQSPKGPINDVCFGPSEISGTQKITRWLILVTENPNYLYIYNLYQERRVPEICPLVYTFSSLSLGLIRSMPVIYGLEILEDSEIFHIMKFDPDAHGEGKISELQRLRFDSEQSELVSFPLDEVTMNSEFKQQISGSISLFPNKTTAIATVKRGSKITSRLINLVPEVLRGIMCPGPADKNFVNIA